MKWYVKCIKNYANFSGRARRSEYWMFLLFNLIILFTLSFASLYFSEALNSDKPFFILFSYAIFIIIPHLAVVVRRLHDINKSGGYWFVKFIPIAGPIWLLILLVEDSWDGVNQYGPNPKGLYNDAEINKIGKE